MRLTDKNGKLSAKELSKVLRKLGKTEREIKCMYEKMGEHELTFEEFRALVQGSAIKPEAPPET